MFHSTRRAAVTHVPGIVTADFMRLQKHFLNLTSGQMPFVTLVEKWVCDPQSMVVVISGGPGTGKTHLVKNTLRYVETTVLAMSFTGIAAKNIGGRTIHSALNLDFRKESVYATLQKELEHEEDVKVAIQKSEGILKEFQYRESIPSVVVIDEVAMIEGWLIFWVLHYFMNLSPHPVLFVAMGDRHQLTPVRSRHNLFSLMPILEERYRVSQIHLTESKRFVHEYNSVIQTLMFHVDANDEKSLFDYISGQYPVVESVDKDMLMEATRAMAFKNMTVECYNKFYIRNKLSGRIQKIYDRNLQGVWIRTSFMELKPDCAIFVTQNGCSTAMNGSQLIFKEYDVFKDELKCLDPESGNGELRIKRNAFGKFPVDLGFAGTVHKFQGKTLDDAKLIINFDGSRNVQLVYTALSRVREMGQILAVQL